MHFLLYLCARLGTHSNYYICLLLPSGLRMRVTLRFRSLPYPASRLSYFASGKTDSFGGYHFPSFLAYAPHTSA